LFYGCFCEQGYEQGEQGYFMSNVEVIGKLMAGAVGVDFVCGTAGKELSKVELAGLLAGLSNHEMNLALAKYGVDEDASRRLLVGVSLHVLELAYKEDWSHKDNRIFVAMAKLAINEIISENLCPNCNGVGIVKIKVCNVCNGTRHKVMSGRKKANIIGVTQVQWTRMWSSRYEDVFEYVRGMDSLIKRTISNRSTEKNFTMIQNSAIVLNNRGIA
jgi:hypothetical protein